MDEEQLAKFEQTAELSHDKEKRFTHHVHTHIPGEVFLLLTLAIVMVSLIVMVAWAFNHPADFVSTSSVLVHGAIWMVTVGAVIGLTWLAIRVIVQPLIEAGHRLTDMVGKIKRHRVHVAHENYAVVDGQFYQVSQDRTNYNLRGEIPKQIAAPAGEQSGGLPNFVRYEDVSSDVPQGHTLLGVGEQGVDTRTFSVLDTCWICGGSKTGKTNTVSLKTEEAYNLGTRFIVCDPHRFKSDSLYNSIRGYSGAFLRPVAQSHDEIVASLNAFLTEAKRRIAGGQYDYDITLIVDEVGSLTGGKGKTPEQVELFNLLYNIARMCGQELRGFGMRGVFISQNAIGLAWLRGFAMTIIVHKLLMENERKVATNNNMQIVRAMDSWPRGRVLVYGLDIEEGQLQLQMPVFSPRIVEADLPDLAPNPFTQNGYSVNGIYGMETPSEARSWHVVNAVNVTEEERPESQKSVDTSSVGNDIREIIVRLNRQNIPMGKIAEAVGLNGRKYPQFMAVCHELGIKKQSA